MEGNFNAWLCHFERCAAANEWDEATHLLKLPVFLHGPAAAYIDSLESLRNTTRLLMTSQGV